MKTNKIFFIALGGIIAFTGFLASILFNIAFCKNILLPIN